MAESWYLEQEIPTLNLESSDAKNPSIKEVETVWRTFAMRQPGNMRRFRHCRGCVYLRGCGAEMVCGYILAENKKRPCPFGAGCKVRKTPKGYKLPAEHVAWAKRIDKEEGELSKEELEKRRKRGREPIWDREYAKALYDKGYAISEIIQIVPVKKATIANYAELHSWYTHKKKRFPRASKEAIEQEKQRYAEWKEEQRRAKEDAESG